MSKKTSIVYSIAGTATVKPKCWTASQLLKAIDVHRQVRDGVGILIRDPRSLF